MSIKQDRMADKIREILSSLLLLDVTDPALQGVTVVDVKLDSELEHAEVFVNALGDDSRQGDVMRGLTRASGFLRREVAQRVRLRRAPELKFHWDYTLSRAEVIERKLDNLVIPPAPVEEAVEEGSNDDENADE